MTDKDILHLPDIKHLERETVFLMIDFYLAKNAPRVGLGGYGYPEAPDDDDNASDAGKPISQRSIALRSKRYCAEKFIGGFVKALQDIEMPPELVNMYLEKIANSPKMPDHVIDAVLWFQQQLIDDTPNLKSQRESVELEHSHLIP